MKDVASCDVLFRLIYLSEIISTSSDQDFLIRAGSNTSSNKRSAPENTNPDVISNMPECIISHILSSLPTREAVRTSVLSKAWEFKWTSIYNIDVEEQPVMSNSFLEFVDRVLTHAQYTKSFHFASSFDCDHSCIENWISRVLIRNVESVVIDCSSWFGFGTIVLPHSLLSCTSLKELRIVANPCILEVPARICLPNLTRLHIQGVEILSETDAVRFDMPLLQICEISCFWPPNIKCVEICAPALTSFVSCARRADDFENPVQCANYTIKIDSGVKLAHFEVDGEFLENFLLTASQVVTATLTDDSYSDEMFVKCESRFRRLLNKFSTIEELSISSLVAQAIAQTKWVPLRKYDKLVHLKLYRSCSWGNHHATYDALLELLHAAPYLKFLCVHVSSVLAYSNDGAYDFDAVVSVPSCIVSHLEEVTLCRLKVNERYLDLAKFLLKNGSKLKKFSASCRDEFKAVLEDVLPNFLKVRHVYQLLRRSGPLRLIKFI